MITWFTGSTKTGSFCYCLFSFDEFHAVSHSGSCAEQVAEFAQSMLVFVLPLSLKILVTQIFAQNFGLEIKNA